MRKKRFMAFLLSLAMAGTSVYTCGVIDVQAAAVIENQEAENPNLEQLANEIQAQAADMTDETDEQQLVNPVVEQVDEPEAQATAGTLSLSGVSKNEAEWGNEVKPTGNTKAWYYLVEGSKQTLVSSGDSYTFKVTDIGKKFMVSSNGDTSAPFTVMKRTIISSYITVSQGEVQPYTAAQQTPSVTVSDTDIGQVVVQEGGYRTTYANNINPGTATATVAALASSPTHRGSASKTFEISKRTLTSVNLTKVDPESKQFIGLGAKVEPTTVEITNNDGIPMVEGKDYTITWTNNESIYGTPTATVTLSNNGGFSGTISKVHGSTYKIVPKDNAKFTGKFDGKEGIAKFNYGTTLAMVKDHLTVSDGQYTVSDGDYSLQCTPATVSDGEVLKLDTTYTLTLTGKGNYAASSKGSCQFTIGAEGVSENDIVVEFVNGNTFDFNGKEQKPAVTVSVNAKGAGEDKKVVSLNKDQFSVEYADNVNAGTAKVNVTLKAGQYTATDLKKSVSFNILPISINSDKVTVGGVKNPVYNGAAQGPAVEDIVISANLDGTGKANVVLRPGLDYTLSKNSISGNIDVPSTGSKYKCIVSANGNFKGTKEIEYAIEPVNISTNKAVSWSIKESYGFTGSKIKPKFEVKYQDLVSDNKTLSGNENDGPTVDYVVTYGDNEKQGTEGTVTIEGKGNYAGKQTKKFMIGQLGFTHAVVSAATYIAKPISANDLKKYVKVYSDDFEINADNYNVEYAAGKDHTETEVGKYPIKIMGTGYYGREELTDYSLEIVPAEFVSTNALVRADVGNGFTFKSTDPNAWEKPELTVSYNGKALVEGTDFTTQYNDRKPGEAKGWVVLTAASKNLKGSISKNFNITKSDFSNAKLDLQATFNEEYVYDGNEQTPSENDIVLVDASHDNVVLSSGDYWISGYGDNTNAGTATVQVAARGNSEYIGTRNIKFTINPRDIADEAVKLSSNEKQTVSGQSYNAEEQNFDATKVQARCLSYNGTYLATPADYEIVFLEDGEEVTKYVNAGEYTIAAKGTGNFKGMREIGVYKVNPQAIQISKFYLDPAEVTYTGEPFEANVVARSTYYSKDFEVIAPELLNKGEYDIVVSGNGNYNGQGVLKFTIKGVTMNESNTQVTFSGVSENGQVLVDVRTEGRRLAQGTDYTYSAVSVNGSDPQAWRVTIYPAGNYEGGLTTNVEFGKIVLEDEDVEISANFTYTGAEQQLTKEQIKVTKGNKTLVEGTDYTVSNPVAATKAGDFTTLSINGMGDFTGVATAKAEIKAIPLVADGVKVVKNVVYTGSAAAPEVEVSVNGIILEKDRDYVVRVDENDIEIGKGYKATIEGIGNYSGEIIVTYDITAPTLDNATIVEEKLPYTGEVQKPETVKVMLGDQIVPSDQYTISYENPESVEVGTYGITVSGTDKYKGTATGTYQIVALTLKDAKVTAKSVVYTGAKAEPQVTVTIGDLTLKEGTDYVVDAGNAVDAKKGYTLSVVGIGNYEGELKTTFDINPKTITKSNVKVTVPSATYNGKAQTPKSASVAVDNRVLAAKDFSFAGAKNAVNAGKVNVTITGKGNYTGTVTGAWFTINPKDLSKGKVSGIVNKIYTGKALKQSVAVTVDGKKLTAAAKTFKVTYQNNKNIGPATLTIDGQGNYKGHISSRSFKIFPAKATIKSLKAGKKRFTVQTKKLSGGVRYQIQYRVKGSKAAYTRIETKNLKKVIKGLKKGKTYTVKVRAYKKLGKKMYYGTFSKAKNVKIKK